MKELNLLVPTKPNLSSFIWEKSWNNRFEIFRHQVVEYRRTRYVFPLNRTCAFSTAVELSNQLVKLIFQPESIRKTIFLAILWLILHDSYNMSHYIYYVMLLKCIAYNVIITSSLRKTKSDSYHRGTICNDQWRHMRSSKWLIKVLRY